MGPFQVHVLWFVLAISRPCVSSHLHKIMCQDQTYRLEDYLIFFSFLHEDRSECCRHLLEYEANLTRTHTYIILPGKMETIINNLSSNYSPYLFHFTQQYLNPKIVTSRLEQQAQQISPDNNNVALLKSQNKSQFIFYNASLQILRSFE